MTDFKREERYIVIKLKHLNEDQLGRLESCMDNNSIETTECVVVESDWSEYEIVWGMLEESFK